MAMDQYYCYCDITHYNTCLYPLTHYIRITDDYSSKIPLLIVCHDIAHKYHSIILRPIHCWPFYKLLVWADLVPIVAVGCDCVYDRLMYLFTDLQIIYRLTGQSERVTFDL